jgi:hypothetical protein
VTARLPSRKPSRTITTSAVAGLSERKLARVRRRLVGFSGEMLASMMHNDQRWCSEEEPQLPDRGVDQRHDRGKLSLAGHPTPDPAPPDCERG